jgi:hypothetical protein
MSARDRWARPLPLRLRVLDRAFRMLVGVFCSVILVHHAGPWPWSVPFAIVILVVIGLCD